MFNSCVAASDLALVLERHGGDDPSVRSGTSPRWVSKWPRGRALPLPTSVLTSPLSPTEMWPRAEGVGARGNHNVRKVGDAGGGGKGRGKAGSADAGSREAGGSEMTLTVIYYEWPW